MSERSEAVIIIRHAIDHLADRFYFGWAGRSLQDDLMALIQGDEGDVAAIKLLSETHQRLQEERQRAA